MNNSQSFDKLMIDPEPEGRMGQSIPRKRILYVITKSVWGGAQKYVYDLATSLPREEFDVAVALGGSGPLAHKLKERHIEVFTIKNFQYSVNPLKEIKAFLELRALFRYWKPDIIHSNSSKAGGLAGASALFYRRPNSERAQSLFTVHGWAFNESRSIPILFMIRLASRLTALLQNKIICVSNFDKESALAADITNPHKLAVIPNGIHPIHFLPREEAQRQLLGHTEPLLIGCVAEWTLNKGILFLVEAFKLVHTEFTDAKLCLIGWGKEEHELRSYITTLGLQDAIHMTQVKPAAPYLKAFDIFVLPSLKEGLPYVLLEASLAGLPIVSTRVGGIPEIIQHEENGILVPSGSGIELSKGLLMLLRDPDLQKRLGAEARTRAESNFGFEAMIRRTRELYSSLPQYASRDESEEDTQTYTPKEPY